MSDPPSSRTPCPRFFVMVFTSQPARSTFIFFANAQNQPHKKIKELLPTAQSKKPRQKNEGSYIT